MSNFYFRYNLFNNYYNTTYIDTLIADYYTKVQIDTNFYDKTYIDNLPSGGGGSSSLIECEVPNGKLNFYKLVANRNIPNSEIEKGDFLADIIKI